jgi:TonB family protein
MLILIAVPRFKSQSQENAPKCAAVPVRKIKYELPKDLKGFKSSPTISYVIEMDGAVTNVKIVKSSGSKAVDEVVLDAVKNSSYRPLKLGCGPIDSRATIIIDFL